MTPRTGPVVLGGRPGPSTSKGSSPIHSFIHSFHCVPDAQRHGDTTLTPVDWLPTPTTSGGASGLNTGEQTPPTLRSPGYRAGGRHSDGTGCAQDITTSHSTLEALTGVAQRQWSPGNPRGHPPPTFGGGLRAWAGGGLCFAELVGGQNAKVLASTCSQGIFSGHRRLPCALIPAWGSMWSQSQEWNLPPSTPS